MRLGIDVGGTHTDAVLMDGGDVCASHKALTTADISSGIIAAINGVLKNKKDLSPSAVTAVMLGTTQFTNAVVERKKLAQVAAIRIGAQSTSALPPFMDWPGDLTRALGGHCHMIDGGHEYDGSEIVPFDEAAFETAITDIRSKNLKAAALCSVFSPVNAATELLCRDRLQDAIPGIEVALSHQIGKIGLYQRENATLLNAALMGFARDIVAAFESSFAGLGINAPFFISQNDGTLMSAGFAADFPVLTFSSGPTNSMRGALYLSGLKDAMVVDVGGTTSDIGMLMNGFPRQSGTSVEIGGVLTNFRMPDVLAIGLGGGSLVAEDGKTVGPDSVGHQLITEGLVFGGSRLTATDIAVAAKHVAIGDESRVAALKPDTIRQALETMRDLLGQNIDKMKTSAGDLPLVVVGGGGFLVPDDLPGISEVIHPNHGSVANAIGAALAQVGAEAEIVYTRGERERGDALAEVQKQAKDNAVKAGADPAHITITEIEETPMSYMAKPTMRLHVKAVGDLARGAKDGARA